MSGEKTEKATPKRMKELRRKGQLGRSQDVSTWVVLGAGLVVLPSVVTRGRDAARDQLLQVTAVGADPDPQVVVRLLGDGLASVVTTVTPLLAVVALTALVVGVAQGGWRFTPLRLHVDHLKPKTAVMRLVGPQTMWQGLKTLLKTAVVGLVMFVAIKGLAPVLVASGSLPMSEVLRLAGEGTGTLLRTGVAAGLLLAALDVVVTVRRNRKQTRMSKQEIKEESKSAEGDPLIKNAIRSRQMAMSRNRMMAAVADADVVLVNPTHVAVALRYEPGKGAPRVVAKGSGAVAARMRAVAGEHRVPMVEDVPLARALHAACELGHEVPEYLFTAVARVLAFVMTLRRRGAAAGQHRVPGGSLVAEETPAAHRARARTARRPARPAADPGASPGTSPVTSPVTAPDTRPATSTGMSAAATTSPDRLNPGAAGAERTGDDGPTGAVAVRASSV
ncbi:EscU/YscU/HrcU family type III secretion system export apparatus switch protein [Cellulomonas marina]|uniref:Flagellar biosynthetic protein FlhB n=1 Tax=Cellulomonas marina TaxID=988821 RepID=A0A1I1AT43_9CELL|nr:EscU/YscU/HrcU family type III secretion system export apparatus switch protein [Cellulomonas marina]GIG30641.1 flagellar biosynthesis protein FlhB [Cellulomonas marina]SFB39483.1 flagellar biosynthetic protein FlhB [Cellulomonas marina]